MNFRLLFLGAIITAAAIAQGNAPAAAQTASISGVVRDKVGKQPLANYNVSTTVRNPNRDVQATTDASGRYTLSGLPPGRYEIEARAGERFLPQVTRMIAVGGQDLSNVNLEVPVDATVSGRVLDENKEPIPGVEICLISREYYLGAAGYFLTMYGGHADDRGRYSITDVPAGRPYLLVALQPPARIPAHSDVPLNPNFRKRAVVRTWYPNSPDREGAVALLMQPGERREAVDIEMKRSPNYCVDGVTVGSNGPTAMRFQIEALQPSSGSSSTGGSYMGAPNGITGPDGKLRICDLSPGMYRVEVQTSNQHGEPVASFGVTDILVRDEDQHGIRFMTSSGQTLEAEVVWDPPAPNPAPGARLTLSFQPTLRTGFPGTADWDSQKTDIPGTVSFQNLFLDDYHVQPTVNGKGLYVKDVTYGGRSVRYEALKYATAMQGSGLRIVVARDGGTISTRVSDKDGNPIPDARVVLFPAGVASEGLLAATMITGQTDQLGQYVSKILAPGAYYALASEEEFDASIESIAKLWRSRTTLNKVELAPSGSAQVNLELIALK